MDDFSTTQEYDDPVCPCKQGNVFLNQLSEKSPPLKFSVNGKETGALPQNLLFTLPNSLEETTNKLVFSAPNGREITLINDLNKFTKNRPEDVGVYMGAINDFPVDTTSFTGSSESRLDRARRLLRDYDMPSPITYSDRLTKLQRQIDAGYADLETEEALNQTIREIEDRAYMQGYIDSPNGEEDLYMLEVPGWLEPSISKGEFDLEEFQEDRIRPVAIAIAHGIGLIDKTTGLEALKDATGGAIDFTVGGTNTVPLALELADMLRKGENRAFIRLAIRMGMKGRIAKVWQNSQGNLLVSFRGYQGLRGVLKGNFGVGNPAAKIASNAKVGIISTAIRNSRNWAGALKSVGGRIPLISYIIVGTFDYAEWLAQPECEREISDLTATLIVDISKLAISTLAGTFFAAFVVGLGAPLVAIVFAGIGAAVFVGVILDWADTGFGITDKVKELTRKEPSAEAFMKRCTVE